MLLETKTKRTGHEPPRPWPVLFGKEPAVSTEQRPDSVVKVELVIGTILSCESTTALRGAFFVWKLNAKPASGKTKDASGSELASICANGYTPLSGRYAWLT